MYSAATHPTLQIVAKRFQANRFLEHVVWGLKDIMKLDDAVAFQMAECGTPKGMWDSTPRRMLLCYELVVSLKMVYEVTGVPVEQIDIRVHDTLVAIAWHEIGHMLHREFDLPVVGNHEDAADQLSTLILLAQGEDAAQQALTHAHLLEAKESQAVQQYTAKILAEIGIHPGGPNPTLEGWDEAAQKRLVFMGNHSLSQERAIDIMCLVYGHSPATRGDLVGPKGLHPMRAERCPYQFEDLQRSWMRLLAPHMRAPTEIALRRCTRYEDHLVSRASAWGFPEAIIASKIAERETSIQRCMEDTLSDPKTYNRVMLCAYKAQTAAQFQACHPS